MRVAHPARLGVTVSVFAAVIACAALVGVANLVRRFREDEAREREFDDWAAGTSSQTGASDR
jgi:hypothetical protein